MSEEEKLWRAKISVLTRGFSKEDAEENIKKNIVVFDDLLSEVEEESLDLFSDYPSLKDGKKRRILRELRR